MVDSISTFCVYDIADGSLYDWRTTTWQNNTSKWHWKPVETGSLSHGISSVVARCVNLYLRMYLGVFVYIACRFRRCIPIRECEQAPRILATISINCVYIERMVRCWNDEWERCSNVECLLDSVECIKLIEKRVWSGVGHLPVSYAGRVVLYPVHS
jgi:hypothetical protein